MAATSRNGRCHTVDRSFTSVQPAHSANRHDTGVRTARVDFLAQRLDFHASISPLLANPVLRVLRYRVRAANRVVGAELSAA